MATLVNALNTSIDSSLGEIFEARIKHKMNLLNYEV